MRLHPLVATVGGPLFGVLGAGMWVAGWRKSGIAVSVIGAFGFLGAVVWLYQIMTNFWGLQPPWFVPAAIAGILYAIAYPAAVLAGVVAWDRSR